jgi:alpha-beta hydrolase superfamily lysophospholipase
MKTHVILVHGFNVYDGGEGTIGKLRPYFEERGCSVEMLSYGHFNLFAPRWRNRDVAQRLSERVADIKHIGCRCIVVAHSNGAAITHLAGSEFGACIDKAVYLNPALERSVAFPASFGAFDVWHNPHDKVVAISKLLPFHPWGDMGRFGATRFDARGKNHNVVNYVSGKKNAHSRHFVEEAIGVLAPKIADSALQA